MRIVILLIATVIVLTGCATTNIISYLPPDLQNKEKSIAVFLDGTANDQTSRTNIAKLYELTVNQNRDDLAVFYTEGVGTDGRVIGAVTGLGIGKDVRDAYQFLSSNYADHDDKIFIFGFSRGAYASRALSGLIFAAGLADFSGMSETGEKRKKRVDKFVRELWKAYKGKMDDTIRKQQIDDTYREYSQWGIARKDDISIEVLGIWDTVEALGTPNYKENVGEVNKRYVDQICNIKHAYHALALDDNRARIYTPILLTGDHLTDRCQSENISLDDRVEEVWFAGAHADVGGGYKQGFLSGISLNWMISRISEYGILPEGAAVYGNPYDVVHDAEGANVAYKFAFKRMPRNVDNYVAQSSYNGKKLKVHESVIERLRDLRTTVAAFIQYRQEENEKLSTFDSEWYNTGRFDPCFDDTESGYEMLSSCESIEVVSR